MKDKSQLRRILFIHEKIRSGINPNAKQLAEHYEGVSDRTIKRDIEYMRECLHAPIVSGGPNKGYSYSEEFFNLPLLMLGKGEFLSLILLEQILPNFLNTPFAGSLESIKNKLIDIFPEGRIKHEQDLPISLQQDALSPIDTELWSVILASLLDSQTVEITYQSTSAQKSNSRKFQPYHLYGNQGVWYVIGFDESKSEIRVFALSRMVSAKLIKESFVRPSDFKVTNHIDENFGVYINQKPITVELEYHDNIKRLIEERKWHPTQKFKKSAGKNIMIFKTNQVTPLLYWVLGWGSEMVVRKPSSLREQLKQILKKSIENYK